MLVVDVVYYGWFRIIGWFYIMEVCMEYFVIIKDFNFSYLYKYIFKLIKKCINILIFKVK